MLKLYGHFFSFPSNQARLTASAAGIDFEYVHVDLTKGEQKLPNYLSVNPFGKVPALDDDGYRLGESSAISRYLACKAGCALYPDDIRERGVIDQWMDFSCHHIRANVGKVMFNKFFAPVMGADVDEKSMAEGEANLEAMLPAVEARLAERAYLAGDVLTIADTAMIAALEPAEMMGFDLSSYSAIQKWRNAIMATGWYKNIHERYGAEMEG